MQKSLNKILTINELALLISQKKEEGHKIVLCHGVFDLLHAGHLFHFKAAKQHGSVLVVSVTPDQYVNKGPHRPHFNENLRLQNIAEIESVDYVVLNEWPTAIETIFKLKPHIYVKGTDYSNAKDDITGNINKEEAAIKEIGGHIVFTNEPSLSSSHLLNEFFPTYSEDARKFLESFKQQYSISDIFQQLDQLSQLKVLIIGEAILDRYTYCNPLAKSTKETMLATKYKSDEDFLGGSLAIANHVANFCKSVSLITHCKSEKNIHDYISTHLHRNIQLIDIPLSDRHIIVKQRFVEPHFLTKMFEIQNINDEPISPDSESKVISMIHEQAPHHDLIIIADYGHGFITQNIVQALIHLNKFICINTQTNSANLGYNLITKYQKANYICIDEPELKLAAHNKYCSIEDAIGILKQN